MSRQYKILYSKVQIPEMQKNLVIRERLLRQMDSTPEKMLILYGTVGYGKTVLMSHYIHLYEAPCAWYHLDDMDNDMRTFLEYLTVSFNRIWHDFSFQIDDYMGIKNETMMYHQIGLDFISCLNEYLQRPAQKNRRVFMVFDDFQVISNEDVYYFIHLLMDYSAPNLKIFLATKSGLPSFAAAFMLREQARILSMEELALTESEVAAVLERIIHVDVPSEVTDNVCKKVEGWPAGTMFVAQYLKQTGFSSKTMDWELISDEALLQEYILNELYRKLPYDIQQFLVHTSVLDEISVDLCNWTLQMTNARSTLNYLLQENLFILRVNKGTGYYRYHSVFKMFLQKYLFPEQKKRILDRAARWYLREGNIDRAVECYMQNDDYDRVAECFVTYGEELARKKQQVTVEHWMGYLREGQSKKRQLPAEIEPVFEQVASILSEETAVPENTGIYVRFFGNFQVLLGRERYEMSWRTRKAAELFACLAERQGKPIRRNELLKLLWPEEYPNNAVAMLHNMLYNIRKELTPFGLNQLISYRNREYAMNMEGISSDLYKIQQLCRAVELEDISSLLMSQKYFEHYWGHYLDGMDNAWCTLKKYYYEKSFLSGCEMLAAYYMKKGGSEQAIPILRAGLSVDAYSENMALMLMNCYGMRGDRKEAVQLYENTCRIYRSELDTEPGDAFVAAYDACIHGVAAIV